MTFDKDLRDLRAALLLGAAGILTTGVFSVVAHAWLNAACDLAWAWLVCCVRRLLFCQQRTRDISRLTDSMLNYLYEERE